MLRAHITSWAQDVWVGMSKACKMLGVAMGQLGDPWARYHHHFVGRLLDGSYN